MNTNVKQLMENIGSCVIDTINNHDLKEVYTSNPNLSGESGEKLFSDDERQSIKDINDKSEKEIYFKKLLNKKLQQVDNKFEYYSWIVKKWGGIERFKRGEDEINLFLENISQNKLAKEQFDIISSYSKISSFVNLNEFFVYDSRVAYVLNWILLKNNKPETTYFPLPNGRNKDFIKYDMKKMLSSHYKGKYPLYKEEEAYFIYCEFIKELFNDPKLNKEKIKEPFYIEMMLFGLFKEIVEEVKNSISITIEN
jgi:hypothetical protein